MGEVRTEYATMESPRPFVRQLAQLLQSLGLPLPMFKGRRLYTYGYGEDAWEITTFIFRDAALPNPAHLIYTKTYCNWGLGINLAIHEACLASAITSDTYCRQIHPTVTMGGVMKMGTLWLPRATGTTCRPV